MNIDALAEGTYSQGTYHYSFNNPIYFIDRDGLSADGYYDDGAGNIVYDPNVNNQEDLDALGIEGATYEGDVYYNDSSGTYYDENGVAHKNMELDWGNMEYEWSFSRWLSNFEFEGDAVDKIGSGFVITGKGKTTKSNNKSENPDEDIYIPQAVIKALTSFAKVGNDRKTGDGRNVFVKKSNTATTIKKPIKKFKTGMSHAKKVKKYASEFGSISISSSDVTTYDIQYWKDGEHHGAPGNSPVVGEGAANSAVIEGMSTFPQLDSVQKIPRN